MAEKKSRANSQSLAFKIKPESDIIYVKGNLLRIPKELKIGDKVYKVNCEKPCFSRYGKSKRFSLV
jgi:hypothetical protein